MTSDQKIQGETKFAQFVKSRKLYYQKFDKTECASLEIRVREGKNVTRKTTHVVAL